MRLKRSENLVLVQFLLSICSSACSIYSFKSLISIALYLATLISFLNCSTSTLERSIAFVPFIMYCAGFSRT